MALQNRERKGVRIPIFFAIQRSVGIAARLRANEQLRPGLGHRVPEVAADPATIEQGTSDQRQSARELGCGFAG